MIMVELFVGSRYPVNRKAIRQKVVDVLTEHRISSAQVSISIVGTRKIQELNEERLHHEGVTDVLSFPQLTNIKETSFPAPEGMGPHLGDIVICFPVAVQQAKRYGKRVDDQINFYVEHSMLHLLGYHHDE